MASRDVIKSVIIGCAFLALISWNVVLHTKYDQSLETQDDQLRGLEVKLHAKFEQSLKTQDDQLRELEGKLKAHDGDFEVHKKLIKSIDRATSRRIKRSLDNKSQPTGGATYIRWGRTVCPDDAELVYKGYAGGEHYTHSGGASEYACLSSEPKYARYTTGTVNGYRTYIYGVEIETDTANNILETSNSKLSPLSNSDVHCAVCRSRTRTSMVMIPGTNECIPGWNMEYWGYLMTAHYSQNQHNYACLDKAPEAGKDRGATNDNGAVMYHVQTGSLPCTPYINNYELTCVVCTK